MNSQAHVITLPNLEAPLFPRKQRARWRGHAGEELGASRRSDVSPEFRCSVGSCKPVSVIKQCNNLPTESVVC
jgi:hypothetical protein